MFWTWTPPAADTRGSPPIGTPTTVTNVGTINVQGTTTSPRYLELNLNNNAGGLINITSPDARQDTATTTKNNGGSVTIGSGAHLAVSGGTFDNASGTLSLTDPFSLNSRRGIQAGQRRRERCIGTDQRRHAGNDRHRRRFVHDPERRDLLR